MVKRFKSKKRKHFKLKYILFIIILIGCFYVVKDFKLARNNQDFIKRLLKDSNYYMKYETNIIDDILSIFIDVKKPLTLIKNGLLNVKSTSLTYDVKNYIKDPTPVKKSDPLVYIYNTHQDEEYKAGNLKN